MDGAGRDLQLELRRVERRSELSALVLQQLLNRHLFELPAPTGCQAGLSAIEQTRRIQDSPGQVALWTHLRM